MESKDGNAQVKRMSAFMETVKATRGSVSEIRKTAVGIRSIDEALGGGFTRGLHFIGGKPGSGKSAIAIAMAWNVAKRGVPALYFSYEMGIDEVGARIFSAESAKAFEEGAVRRVFETNEVFDVDARAGFDEAEWADYETVAGRLAAEGGDFCFVDARDGGWTADKVFETARSVSGGAEPFVVIDYLQDMPSRETGQATDKQKVESSISELRNVAARLGCPIVVLSSLNRNGYDASKANAESAFKETGFIEYAATTLVVISEKPDSGTLEAGGARTVELFFAKQRNGTRGATAKLRFDPKTSTFKETSSQDARVTLARETAPKTTEVEKAVAIASAADEWEELPSTLVVI